MKLIIGLGNPGKEYEKSRHNFGFLVVDALAEEWGGSFGKARFKASILAGKKENEKIVLVKPLTFMNLCGEAVAGALHYYKAPPEDLLIVVDDLDLPLGGMRWAGKGSAGGHKGLLSIIEHLGTPNFCRLRLGIGKPGQTDEVVDYVLSTFSKDERAKRNEMVEKAREAVWFYIENGLDKTMNKFN